MTEASALILIIDDQPQNLLILSSTLKQAGYQVAAANSGAAALRLLEKRQPDLMLCDIFMPEMDGYAVCRAVKANPATAELPFLFLTAQTDSQALQQCFAAGAQDYLLKPFNPPELLARIASHVVLQHLRRGLQHLGLDLQQHRQALQALADQLPAAQSGLLNGLRQSADGLAQTLETLRQTAEAQA